MKTNKILLLISIFVFVSCNLVEEKPENVVAFYFDVGGFDYSRIPLIKPFELIKVDKEWNINTSLLPYEKFKNVSIYRSYGDFGPIDSIYCKDSIIYGHKGFFEYKAFGVDIPEWWFLIDMADSNIYSYENRADFIKSLQNQADIRFMTPDSLHKIFYEDYILPWFDDSLKAELQKHAEKQKNEKFIFDFFLEKLPFVSRN